VGKGVGEWVCVLAHDKLTSMVSGSHSVMLLGEKSWAGRGFSVSELWTLPGGGHVNSKALSSHFICVAAAHLLLRCQLRKLIGTK
jgi:hypothetical protein